MNHVDIFQIVKKKILEILPEIPTDRITIDQQLRALGANSIDRMEIITLVLEHLNLRIPLVEFGNCKNIQGLVDIMYRCQDA